MKKTICVVLSLMFVVLLAFGLAACKKVADNTEHFDAITKTAKLTKSYEGKSFLRDGIGSATLDALTDGDTTRFKLEQGDIVSIRYHGVDTPESTGGVEKWGKAASLFVKQQLIDATEIVLEATATPAEHDSYGTRYLGYVWYKNSGDTDFKNLNIELIENGYSENQSINTSKFPYYEQMQKAEDFAHSIQLRVFSKLDDPLYSTDPVKMTIKEFWNNTEAYYSDETEAGAYVVFEAALTSIRISETQTHTYTAMEYEPETGKTYTLNIYCAYSGNQASRMKIGHLYRIVGNIQKYYGQFQVSGILYDTIFGPDDPAYTTEIQKNYYLTFSNEMTYNSRYSTSLYTDVTVVSSKVEGTTLTIVGTALQRTDEGTKGESVEFTFKVTVPQNYNNVFTAGKVFSVNGFRFDEKTNKITVVNYSDIKIK